ncbi:14064_t:CDS:2 [Dentiscutata erythropus]|uniref:14064_t:CDS:1 n=1 Tax=Dentiscutata erythropus TaxID=1348616 RepID=A0A9N9C000_9GLOM|nr:14064_t:CDS:2 [Dentiscutata erythropus]
MKDGVEDGNSGDIYDKFFGIYDLRKVFAVEFFAWLLAQGIESDFNDDQSTNNFFLRVDKLQNDTCWRPYKKDDKKLVSRTLEYIENLENKLIPMTSFDKSLRKRFITNIRAINVSKWTLMDKNNIEIDVVKTICRSITEEMIMNLEYNNPLLSYVADFSNLPKEIKDAFDEQMLITMTAPPIKFYRDMDPISEKYLVNLYENQQVCEKLFPQVSDTSSLFLEQYFLWKACCKLFEMWNSNNFNKDFTTTFNEGTWEHFALHPIFDILTLSLDKCVLRWGESTSSASKYRKTENIRFEMEIREHLDRIMAPFLTFLQAKKADTWIEMMIAKNLYEIVFAETSGSLFQATCTTKKVYNDKCKLIHFGHDSKNKMLDKLIEKKCTYLSDWKNLCNDIRKAELLLFQAYEVKLKVLVLDCPAHPFCHVRELFDLDIPYKKVAIEEFKIFIQALWAIRCALSDIIHDYEKIGERLLKDYNKIAGSGPYEVNCGVRGYQSHPSP